MKYMLLIYDDEKAWGSLAEEQRMAVYAEYMKLSEDLEASGSYIGGSELQPTTTATSLRVRDGKRLVTDGPFAETREQLGGYYLVEANDLDAAMAIASKIPSVRTGTIEIRPLAEYDG
jgi:hypothetical protein